MQMATVVIADHRAAAVGIIFGMQGIGRIQAQLEALHPVGPPHHRGQQAAHPFDRGLLQPVGTILTLIQTSIGQRQPPGRKDAVYIVPPPGISIIAMRIHCRTGREQPGDRILTRQHDLIDLMQHAVQPTKADMAIKRLTHQDSGSRWYGIALILTSQRPHRCEITRAKPGRRGFRLIGTATSINHPPQSTPG